MATNRKQIAKRISLYLIADWEGQSGLQLQGQLTYSNIAIREMIVYMSKTQKHILGLSSTLKQPDMAQKSMK